MTAPNLILKTVPLASITAANIGVSSGGYGDKILNEYCDKRRKYLGKVLEVTDVHQSEQVMSDIWEMVVNRTVTVWDGAKATTFVSDRVTTDVGTAASAWEVDATKETVTAYRRWLVLKAAPSQAAYAAKECRSRHEASVREERASLLRPAPRRGQLYEVVDGRKYPHGLRGVLFWSGSNKWGESYGLATSDRKLPNGRNADVIFVNPKNLKFIGGDEVDAKVEEVNGRLDHAVLAAYEDSEYKRLLLKEYEALATKWGISLETLVNRTVQVVTEEIAAENKRIDYITQDSWACDGPAYKQVQDEYEMRKTVIEKFERLLKAVAPAPAALAA